jgi:hypothetical protein
LRLEKGKNIALETVVLQKDRNNGLMLNKEMNVPAAANDAPTTARMSPAPFTSIQESICVLGKTRMYVIRADRVTSIDISMNIHTEYFEGRKILHKPLI